MKKTLSELAQELLTAERNQDTQERYSVANKAFRAGYTLDELLSKTTELANK